MVTIHPLDYAMSLFSYYRFGTPPLSLLSRKRPA